MKCAQRAGGGRKAACKPFYFALSPLLLSCAGGTSHTGGLRAADDEDVSASIAVATPVASQPCRDVACKVKTWLGVQTCPREEPPTSMTDRSVVVSVQSGYRSGGLAGGRRKLGRHGFSSDIPEGA